VIKVQTLVLTEGDNTYRISAFADSKSEVTPQAEIIGLPEGANIDMGSSILTADGDLAFMKSTGEWNWS